MNLPVCGMEQEIVETIYNNEVVILCGETGSGKSTQVPQFLYEAGYGKDGLIAITQPRRVAATSTAERVAVEMNQNNIPVCDRLVGYHIRHDRKTIGKNTRIIFATDGILLREATSDLLLRKYSVVILDEAHGNLYVLEITIHVITHSTNVITCI
jgi:ATP-dependent RNA helicase DHX37/DHR1